MDRKKRGVKRTVLRLLGLGAVTGLTVIIVATALNFATIRDYFVGIGYEPSQEMAEIREALGLTDKARLVFDASWPELNERGDFNRNCRADGEGDMAILGCYADGRIYIYNIQNEELPRVRELTAAHELLHAVWARMSDAERERYRESLARVKAENRETLESELSAYDEVEQAEELYVRAGIEIKDLPEDLERHYAEIFVNQDEVVEYYDGYIAVFREIEGRLKALCEELARVKIKLDGQMAEYERRVQQLSADVVSFNACAAVAGCFRSDVEFDERRAGLFAEQGALSTMYEAVNELVDGYNALVDEYNANVVHGQMLNDATNSLAVPDVMGETRGEPEVSW